jgi:Right handed beta helix region
MIRSSGEHGTSSSRQWLTAIAVGVLAIATIAVPGVIPGRAAAITISVPEDYPTIQRAIDAAPAGAVIDIAPGTYAGPVVLDVSVTLLGRERDPREPFRNTTILSADSGESVVTIEAGVSPPPALVGLVFRGGHDGVSVRSPVRIKGCAFIRNRDGVDLELGGGGVFVGNLFRDQIDDGVDLDHAVHDVRIVRNRIVDSRDDGIEIRLHDDAIPTTARLVIGSNQILRSAEDGIQLIDYADLTNRWIVIRRNLVLGSAMAGLGLMDGAETIEDYRAAPIDERVDVVHNTFLGNDLGISGGARLYAVNNVLVGHRLALKGLTGDSIATHSLFWDNVKNVLTSRVDRSADVVADPLLDPSCRLGSRSPAIDAGTAWFKWNGDVVVDRPPSAFRGEAPDIGWDEAA